MFGSIKSAYEIAKDLTELKVSTEFKTQVTELLDALLQARMDAADAVEQREDLLAQIRSLQNKLDYRESWNEEKERYRLVRIGPSASVYTLKTELLGENVDHILCPQCFVGEKKGFLQPSTKNSGRSYAYRCSGCSSEVAIDRFELERFQSEAHK